MAAEHDDVGESVSMVDILEEEQQREEDANAVLGGSDDKQCTYILGYVQRQAIYSCATCITGDMEPAGVCLACSLDCHDGHELYELYTKRNFRCDCGNRKFKDLKCKLSPEKCPVNENNQYNQNFRGMYCTCHRPYPDPEDEADDDDEMIQCIVCEDWYHGRHLKAAVPDGRNYEEMICHGCMEKCSFLSYYRHLQTFGVRGQKMMLQKNCDSGEAVDVTGDPDTSAVSGGPATSAAPEGNCLEAKKSDPESKADGENSSVPFPEKSQDECGLPDTTPITPKADGGNTSNSEEATAAATDTKSHSSESKDCILEGLKQTHGPLDPAAQTTTTFWQTGWRKSVCTCSGCKELYVSRDVLFLCDSSDTITAYEEHGRSKNKSASNQYERGMEALAGMDRVQQVEMLHGFNDMKMELKDYLKKFAESGKVVREEDIREFFSEMAGRKKQKVDMSYFCK